MIGAPSLHEDDAGTGWSQVAELYNRDPGAEFSDQRLDEAEERLREAVENRTADGPDLEGPVFPDKVSFDESCSVSCGSGCGECSASASCDQPACTCRCSCKEAGSCQDCNWCGCDWCGKSRADYDCTASCNGVTGTSQVAYGVTIDGESDFTREDFAAWTEGEGGDADVVAQGIVTVAKKDLAGRLVTGNGLDTAAETWADLLVDFARWANE